MSDLTMPTRPETVGAAVLDTAHVGDIQGALGSIRLDQPILGRTWVRRLKTLLAIVGPGLIVMVGDNDAGAFGTYTQAGQNFGTHLLWTLLLLVPVLYINQEMVLRLGAVSRVGHARLILARFGKFWGAFSVFDLFILNALTIVTEFIGISLALTYLGLPVLPGVVVAAVLVIAAASTGSFKRFEQVSMILVVGSLLLVPIVIMAHPSVGQIAHDFLIPSLPGGSSLSAVMLLVIAIVGTTIAPWQLFFQQSYVIDKRITAKYINYERVDLWIGIGIVVIGAAAMMAFAAAAFGGHAEFGHYVNAGQVAAGLGKYVSHIAGILFAIALLDASVIGTAAVSLSTAYAVGDLFAIKHSLHRKPTDAKAFYAVFVGIILLSALVVVIPGSPLGLITEGVQTLAGVLLPSATVFLLLLCNDKAVLGPWVNKRITNVISSVVVGALVLMSLILMASVVDPHLSARAILMIIGGGIIAGAVTGIWALARWRRNDVATPKLSHEAKLAWQMPPVESLGAPVMSMGRKAVLGMMWVYLIAAGSIVIVSVVQIASVHH